jgi:hypothetical protein
MVRKWVVPALVAVVALGLTGCDSGGGSTAAPVKLTRKNWTPGGLATAQATVAALTQALPGQCVDAGVSDFAQLPNAMQVVHSTVEPTAQMTCNVNDEVVEITVFANARDRDRFVNDRSTGLCTLARAQAKKYKSRFVFPGLRWDVGAGNMTLQPDSQGLARRLSLITGGAYDGRACAGSITADWNSHAIATLDALGKRIATAGHGCGFVDLTAREEFGKSVRLSDAQLPAAIGTCQFDADSIAIVTYARATPHVKKFIAEQLRAACLSDPATGRIDGDKFVVIAPGTIAEQVHAVVGGRLAPTSCA